MRSIAALLATVPRCLLAYHIISSICVDRAAAGISLSLSVGKWASNSKAMPVRHGLGVCNNATWWPLTTVPEVRHPSPHATKSGLVIAHCAQDLSWVAEDIERLRTCEHGRINVVSIHVYSKCGNAIHNLPPWAKVTRMTNVGRNDHIMAWHLANNVLKPLTIFIKDSYYANRRLSHEHKLVDMCTFSNAALQNGIGMGCGTHPRHWITQEGRYASGSVWHAVNDLVQFQIDSYQPFSDGPRASKVPFQSPNRPLNNWLEQLHVVPHDKLRKIFKPGRLVPVCYGGQFAVKRENVKRVSREGWDNLAESLVRGDNVEEGHFAERSWGALLTEDPRWKNWNDVQRALLDHSRIVHRHPLDGMLTGCGPPGPIIQEMKREQQERQQERQDYPQRLSKRPTRQSTPKTSATERRRVYTNPEAQAPPRKSVPLGFFMMPTGRGSASAAPIPAIEERALGDL